jgi:enoyl-CoA hydratase/carnithine racemase
MNFNDLDSQHLLCRQDGHVALITLNRPDTLNALSLPLVAELHAALDVADQDPSVRSILLTGAGRAFSSGYDLDVEEEPPSTASEVLRHWWRIDLRSADRLWHMMTLSKPVVAAVDGWCLGGGFWYALAADVTLASERAVFGQPEVREIQNSSFLLPALVGWKHAHRYALTGDHFDATEAARIGAINEVVPHDELQERAFAFAQRVALVPPDSVRVNKAITIRGLEAMGLKAGMSMGAALSIIVHASTDSDDLAELRRIREEEGMRASLKHRDDPFRPEPGGPRSAPSSLNN